MTPKAPGPSGSRYVAVEWLLVAFLVAIFVRGGFVPGWRTLNTDFPNYFVAASVFRRGLPFERLYDWIWIAREKDHLGLDWGVVGYIPLTPFSALVLAPLTGLAPLVAKHVWNVFNLGLLAATIGLLQALTDLPVRRVAWLVFLTVVPLATSFQFGQQHLLVLFLLALAAWLYVRDRDVLTGIVLGVAAALKIYPALFGLYFLVKRRWSALVALGVSGALLLLVGVPLFGREAMRAYIVEVIPRSLAGEGNDPYYAGFNTPAILLRRLFVREPELNPHPLADFPAGYAVLQPCLAAVVLGGGLWYLSAGTPRTSKRERLEWGAFVLLLLVSSTSASTYHFCALILATVLAVDFLLANARPRVAVALVVLHAIVSAPLNRFAPSDPAGWAIFLGFPRLYALLGYAGVYLWALARVEPPAPRSRRATFVMASLLVAFAASGLRSNLRRDASLPAGTTRLAVRTPALVANAPSLGGERVYFSEMADEGYVLARDDGAIIAENPRGTDVFHPSVTRSSPDGWVEVAGRRSHLATFARGATTLRPSALPPVVDDAESPVVSRDGRYVAFLRERDQGRRSLWRLDLTAQPEAPREQRLTSSSYDVLEAAFFPEDQLVFAAATSTGPRLFVIDAVAHDPTLFATAIDRARYPAVSPDGRTLVYSGLEHGAWQLHEVDLETRADRALTHADCNAVSPAWDDGGTAIVFASDCGRNLGNTALYRLVVAP